MIKRLLALLCCTMLAVSSACAQETADVIRKLLAVSETSKQQHAALNDARAFVDFDLLAALNPDCVGWLYQGVQNRQRLSACRGQHRG